MDKTNIADRMKGYEKLETQDRFIPLLPIYARLDGRAFHTFTKGLDRPFDKEFMSVMQQVTKRLVEETGAEIGYTQSDEISLFWKTDSFFAGKKQKMISTLASIATAEFILAGIKIDKLRERIERKPPNFDCRVFQLPNQTEVTNTFYWRELDATRNSLSMLAQSLYSHKQLHGKGKQELHELCFTKGQNWNDLDPDCKRGSWFRKVKVMKRMTEEELLIVPEAYREEGCSVLRSEVQKIDLPVFSTIENREEVLYDAEVKPVIIKE